MGDPDSPFLFTSTQALVSLATFATYILIDENNVLDTKKAFVTMTLFGIMQTPMIVLPMFYEFAAKI